MKMTCGYCNNEFTLDKIHIKKEVVKENHLAECIFDAILGTNFSDETYKYFIYCPKCHKKIGKIN